MLDEVHSVIYMLTIANHTDAETVKSALEYLGYDTQKPKFSREEMDTIWDDVEQHITWNTDTKKPSVSENTVMVSQGIQKYS